MKPPRIVVIGAGAFGGWTALELVRRGAEVTVIDAWGPGNARASSGGRTRIIRATYGSRVRYTELAVRALHRWRDFQAGCRATLLRETGVLWLFGGSPQAEHFARVSADALRAHRAPCVELDPVDASRRYPQIDFSDVSSVMFEREAGYLLARRSCEQVLDRVRALGGTYRQAAAAAPADADRLRSRTLDLVGGETIAADAFVFACGPWLGSLFPDAIGRRVIATRQEVYYFAPPPGDPRFIDPQLPVWIDFGERQIYGIPEPGEGGFKVADDTTGPEMDPTRDDRETTPARVEAARGFVARRFPGLAGAPLAASEVCQYEATPDSDLIIDRHPDLDHVWLAGGGSGHGFKLGPAIGEDIASLVLGDRAPDPGFRLSRFGSMPADGWQAKWV